MPLILTEVLEWAFEHEDELPTDDALLLKRLAWMIAQRMYDRAVSSCGDLRSELSARCGGERGTVTLNVYAPAIQHREKKIPKQGWYLHAVRHLECNNNRTACKCEYAYVCRSNPNRRHLVTISWFRDNYEFARFELLGKEHYWWSTPNVQALIPDCNWGLYIDQHTDHLTRTKRCHLIELATFGSASVDYIRYDRTNMTAIAETTFTNSMTINWDVRRYADPSNLNSAQFNRVPFHRDARPNHICNFVDYDSYIFDGSFFSRLHYVEAHLGMLLTPTRVFEVKPFPHLSAMLSRQLRDRMYGIARKLLLVKAQWKEEARAADPVKKCAACAVQAAKDQLVLGLEPAAKRRCV